MTEKQSFGEIGEDLASRYLLDNGYELLHRNWRSGHHEVDIVAEFHGLIVFVEVKARKDENFLPAWTAVDKHKRKNLSAAAQQYMAENKLTDNPLRFDVITVVGQSAPYKLTHYKEAFEMEKVVAHAYSSRW